MRHLLVGAALLLTALIVTLGAATVLENWATARRDEPASAPATDLAGPPKSRQAPAVKLPPVEQSRSLSLVIRKT